MAHITIFSVNILVLRLEAKALISVFVDEEMKRVVDVTDTTQSSKNDNQELWQEEGATIK